VIGTNVEILCLDGTNGPMMLIDKEIVNEQFAIRADVERAVDGKIGYWVPR